MVHDYLPQESEWSSCRLSCKIEQTVAQNFLGKTILIGMFSGPNFGRCRKDFIPVPIINAMVQYAAAENASMGPTTNYLYEESITKLRLLPLMTMASSLSTTKIASNLDKNCYFHNASYPAGSPQVFMAFNDNQGKSTFLCCTSDSIKKYFLL